MGNDQLIKIIKNVATENGYTVEGSETVFEIYKDQWHSTAFQIRINSAGYLQVHQWEDTDDEDGIYGRAIYSLRSLSDVIVFCDIIIASLQIRARR